MSLQISKKALDFYKKLKKNNNRDWFNEHKTEFKAIETDLKVFYNSIYNDLNLHDDVDKLKVFRIYRDVRFSKDKTPFKPHFAGSFHRKKPELRGSYYLRIRPGESFMACGFWNPEKNDLLRIRKELELDAQEFRDILENKEFKNVWGTLQGDEVKTAPKGFDKTHPDIDLIRKKQFIFTKYFTDKEVLDKSFYNQVSESFKAIRPYFDYMSDVLTTNLNGESIL